LNEVELALARSAAAKIRKKNSSKISDSLWMEVRIMASRHHKFGLCTSEVGAPIPNDTIRAIDAASFTAISDDRIVF
jgi:hypothetical protein